MADFILKKPDSPEGLSIDGTTETFKEDVIDASKNKVVLAYFWSASSPPTAAFGELLGKYVKLAGGPLKLVKYKVEDNTALAQKLRLTSVPATLIFNGGGLVESLPGVLSETQVKALIRGLGGKGATKLDDLMKEGRTALAEKRNEEAAHIFQTVLSKDPAHVGATGGFLRALLNLGQADHVRNMLEGLPGTVKSPEIDGIRTFISLEGEAPKDMEKTNAAFKKNPKNFAAAYDYAFSSFVSGRYEESLDLLLDLIKNNKEDAREKAKKLFLRLLEALGKDDPLTPQSRRKLSSLLFS